MRAGILSPPPLLAPLALLAFAALALVLVYARPLEYAIFVGAGECDAPTDFLGGTGDCAAALNFHAPERNPAGVPFRWTRDRSTLVFHAAGLAFPANRPQALELALEGTRPAGAAQPRLTVEADGQIVETGPVPPGQSRPHYTLPGAFAGPVDRRVALAVSETFTVPGLPRALGVAVLGPARLVEGAGDGLPLPPLGAWWRWLGLVLGGYGAALALLRRPDRAALAGGALVILLTGAALVARVPFWSLVHLPLLAVAAALPVLWRRDLAWALAAPLAALERRLGRRAPAAVALGLLPAGAAQALLTAGLGGPAPAVALALYWAGLALIVAALRGGRAVAVLPGSEPPAGRPRPGRGELAALAAILALAAGVRFYRLDDIPFGLWRDEASHGLEALRILREPSYRPVYIPAISLPGLYPSVLAAAFDLFGASIGTLRGVTAAAGVASVGALYAVARRVWGGPVALVAAFLAAVGSWRVSIDRLAFATATTGLCTLLALYAALRALDAARGGRRGWGWFAAAGALGGLAAWGYYPGRFALVAVAGATLLFLLTHRRAGCGRRFLPTGTLARPVLLGLALCLAVATLTLLPLGGYALARPDDFFRRSGQVFLLGPQYLEGQTALEAVERNIGKHLVMFNWRGEPNARHHAPGWPLLDGVTALSFAVGLALAVAAAWPGRGGGCDARWAARCTLLWLVVLLLPSIVSVDAPSAVRAGDAAPAAYLLAALGLAGLLRGVAGAGAPASRAATPALAGAALALVAALNLWLYFARLPGDPRVLGKFYIGETRAGLAIAAAHEREPRLVAYLPRATPSLLSDSTLRFTADGTPLRELPPDGSALPPGPAMVVVPRGEDRQEFERWLAAARRVGGPAGLREVRGEAPPGGGEPAYIAFVRD